MIWGFCVNDGWYPILDTLSAQLEKEIIKLKTKYPNEERIPRATQVKEKFGGLRFYMSTETDEIDWYIQEAVHKASHTCETCGNPGKSRLTSWIVTACDACYLKIVANEVANLLSQHLVETQLENCKYKSLVVPKDKKEEYYKAFANTLKNKLKDVDSLNIVPEYFKKKPLGKRITYFFHWNVCTKFKFWWWRNLVYNTKHKIKKLIWNLKRKYEHTTTK